MHRYIFRALVPATLAAIAGCSSTPPSQFYRVTAVADAAAASSDTVVVVGPVSVPASWTDRRSS